MINRFYILLFSFALALSAGAQVVLEVDPNDPTAFATITEAIHEAEAAWQTAERTTTIRIAPGNYYEELTINVPYLRLENAYIYENPTAPDSCLISLYNGGTTIGPHAVRISWYVGHGYQYESMNGVFNYGGSRTRLWNASVLVCAPYFSAEGIIFENSFNQYISPAEMQDSMVDISQAKNDWTAKERPKRIMPERPKELFNTDVQKRFYRERASALSFTSEARHCTISRCRVVGRQDALYGNHQASVHIRRSVLMGAVDYIFGGFTLLADTCTLVSCTGNEKNDHCYITAGRAADSALVHSSGCKLRRLHLSADSIPTSEFTTCGMLFNGCNVRFATADEVVDPGNAPILLGRPWRWWGQTTFVNTQAEKGVLAKEAWSTGLTKGIPTPFVRAYNRKGGPRERQRWLHVIYD